MQEYVLGFMFDKKGEKVALIEKIKPKWQEGLLNGIGGKIEEDESAYTAMTREFFEETGVHYEHWNFFTQMQEDGVFKVYVFYAFSDDVYNVKTVEQEEVYVMDLDEEWKVIRENSVSNIPWLLMACLDKDVQSARLARLDVFYE